MKSILLTVCALFICNVLVAQTPVWQPSAGHTQQPIWPGTPPDARPNNGLETFTTTGKNELVGGRPWSYVGNVSKPTMTVYSPTGKNTGAAVVVFPAEAIRS